MEKLVIEDLWIGDLVYIASLKENALWEGLIDPHTAKIKHGENILAIPLKEIQIAKEIMEVQDFEIEEENDTIINPLHFPNSIDLHIEKLDDAISHQTPDLILNYQIRVCKNYIEKAISCQKANFTIIHGIGKGVLKQEVLHLLKNYTPYQYHTEQNEGGAIEVWMKY